MESLSAEAWAWEGDSRWTESAWGLAWGLAWAFESRLV